jgi:hypothetical protein
MTFDYKKNIRWIVLGIVIIAIGTWLIYHYTTEKSLRLTSPNGKEVWSANEKFRITWKSRNISRVGIILIKGARGEDIKWIAKDVPAIKRKYDWHIFAWERPSDDYKIAVFEYPWKEGNLIDYSDDFFTILGPKFASCDNLSIEAEWPFVPSDFPNLRKVFITEGDYNGNLGLLEGADKICQQEAQNKGYDGSWKAFLGDDTNFAVDRLNLQGIFVEAKSSGSLPGRKTCHRLLGKSFDDFLRKLSDPLPRNSEKFNKDFLDKLSNIWLGRITRDSLRECVVVEGAYSFTTTCQNWTSGLKTVPAYQESKDQQIRFPVCFTRGGVKTDAVYLAGLSSGIIRAGDQQTFTTSLGKSCSIYQKLLCIQQ